MRNVTETRAVEMVTALGDRKLMGDADKARAKDPVDDLKMSVFGFFKDTIAKIAKMEALQAKASDALDRRLANDEVTPLPLDDIMRIYNSASDELRRARESIISLFRPVPGAPSLLINSVGNPGDGADGDPFESMSAEDKKVLEDVRLLLEDRRNKGEKKLSDSKR